MAAITTTANGFYDDTATWTGGVVPVAGDTITINHAVTVRNSHTVGLSPAANDATAAIAVVGTAGKLTINGGTLVVRGDISLANAQLIGSGAGVLEFDASGAASPSTAIYRLILATTTGQSGGGLYLTGTSTASRFIVRSNSGGANARILRTSGGHLVNVDCRYVHFLRMGDASNTGFNYGDIAGTARTVRMRDCLVESCGVINVLCNNGGTTWAIERTAVLTPASTTPVTGGCNNTLTTGSRRFVGNYIEGQVNLAGHRDIAFDENVWTRAPSGLDDVWASSRWNLLIDKVYSSWNVKADAADNYHLVFNANTNPHPWVSSPTRSQVLERNIFENAGTSVNGDLVSNGAGATPVTLTFRNNIVLPNAIGLNSAVLSSNSGYRGTTIVFEHNTGIVGGTGDNDVGEGCTLIRLGETYPGHPGMLTSCKSNLAYGVGTGRASWLYSISGQGELVTGATQANPCVLTSNNHGIQAGQTIHVANVNGMTQLNGNTYTVLSVTTNTVTIDVDGTAFGAYTSGGFMGVMGLIAPADAGYNGGYNLMTGAVTGGTVQGIGYAYSSASGPLFTTGGYGVGDVTQVDPQFVDRNRCFGTFDTAYLGNAAATAWATATSYAVGDIRSHTVSGYFGSQTINVRCTSAHTSDSASEPLQGSAWMSSWEFAGEYRIREAILAGTTYQAGTPQATTRDLVEWVRAGFAPTNPAYRNAGHDGVTIGAVEGEWEEEPDPAPAASRGLPVGARASF